MTGRKPTEDELRTMRAAALHAALDGDMETALDLTAITNAISEDQDEPKRDD